MDGRTTTNQQPRGVMWQKRDSWVVAISTILLTAVLWFVAKSFDGKLPGNSAAAIVKLREVTMLQREFAAAHQEQGFACDFDTLAPLLNPADRNTYNAFARSRTRAGYVFAISNCQADTAGRIRHYELTAIPQVFGETGRRAFCSDESAIIWYDKAGSAEKCLMRKYSLQ